MKPSANTTSSTAGYSSGAPVLQSMLVPPIPYPVTGCSKRACGNGGCGGVYHHADGASGLRVADPDVDQGHLSTRHHYSKATVKSTEQR